MTVPVSVHTLGAGSEVGRSCFLITIDDTTILVDAGVHLSPKAKADRVPVIPPGTHISAVFITHYHLDHVGALPYLTHVTKDISDCDIYMTAPTKILSPSILVDYSHGPNGDLYCANHVHECFLSDRIKTVGCGEEVRLSGRHDFVVNMIYAGHVVGGVMLLIKYKGVSVVYTGDFSVLPDSLLRPICIPPALLPRSGVDVVITESTHATTLTPTNKSMETIAKEICGRIEKAIRRGGSVLIPVFAVGRTQELASMIRRHGLGFRMFTTSPTSQRAGILTSSLHTQWLQDPEDPCVSLGVNLLRDTDSVPAHSVIFASPAMIEGGSSLQLFLQMCEDRKNLVILTGYCNKDTVGNSVILFAAKNVPDRTVTIHGRENVKVNCECFYSPFTSHTDSVGIVNVLKTLRPKNGVVLVHGQRDKMERFRDQLAKERIVPDSCRVEIPQNYDILNFGIDVPQVDAYSVETDEDVKVTRHLQCYGMSSNEVVRKIINERMPTYMVEGETMGPLRVSDKWGGYVSISLEDGGIQLDWLASRRLGSEWIAFNPLVSAICHAIGAYSTDSDRHDKASSFGHTDDDAFSFSECSN